MFSKVYILICVVVVVYGEDSRIVGGKNATSTQFPYQASLRYNNEHFCGGSIITPRTILTAAHCNGMSLDLLTVVVGSNLLDNGGWSYKVRYVITHEFWDKQTLENDVGLVILDEPIVYNERVQPIPLATYNIGDKQALRASGWGLTEYPGIAAPNNLQFLDVKTIGFAECRSMHSGYLFYSQICTLTKEGEGLCSGDSGGPLVASGQLHGIASAVYLCARGKPDFSTRVYSHLAWIESNLQ